MEGLDENDTKRKDVDIQEAPSSSNLASSSSPSDQNKRRLRGAAAVSEPEFIRKQVNVIRRFTGLEYHANENIKAIEALERIFHVDEERIVDLMCAEGIPSLLIEQISETPPPSGDNSAITWDLEERALSLLKEIVTVNAEVGRVIIEEGSIPRLFRLLKREHLHFDDEVPVRLKTIVFETLEKISQNWAEELLRSVLSDYNGGVGIIRGMMSPHWRVQILACKILWAFGASRIGEQVFVTVDCATQLAVMLSCEVAEVRSVAAGTIMALCFSEEEARPAIIDIFISGGVLKPIVHMLHDLNEECGSLAARMLRRFLRERIALTTTFTLAGAVRPLIQMLYRPRQLKDAVFALDHLSISVQAEAVASQILLEGGLAALMEVFRLSSVQTDPDLAPVLAALLFRLAGYRDGLVFFIKTGGRRMLRTTEKQLEAVRDTADTFSHHMEFLLSDETNEYSAKSLVLAAREANEEDEVGLFCADALAELANPNKLGAIFVYHDLLKILFHFFGRVSNEAQQEEAANALYTIACRSREFLHDHALANNLDAKQIIDEAFSCQSYRTPRNVSLPRPLLKVSSPSDVTFLLDNDTQQIRAHKRVLSEASPVFRALLADDYFQDTGGVIVVPNIGFKSFKSVIDFIYAGELGSNVRHCEYYDILIAADFYGILSLKRECELFIARYHLGSETVADIYGFAEAYHSKLLMHACILYILEYHRQVRSLPWYATLVQKIIPEMRKWFPTLIPGPQHKFTPPLTGL